MESGSEQLVEVTGSRVAENFKLLTVSPGSGALASPLAFPSLP